MIVALGLLALWLVGCFALPRWRWVDDLPSNGRNWPGFFVVRRGLPYGGLPVWAQEYHEARAKWRWFPVAVVLTLVGKLIPAWAWYERKLELMGHEIEVQTEAWLGGDEAEVRHREAEALAKRYRAFKGWTVSQCLAALENRSAKAERWVKRYIPLILRQGGKGD